MARTAHNQERLKRASKALAADRSGHDSTLPLWKPWALDLADDVVALVNELERAERELYFTHDRGDHLVYRQEWEEFDRWQRWAEEQRKDAEKYQPTAQEFNDAMEGK